MIITLSTCITTEFIFQQGLESKSRKAVCPSPSICDTCMHIPMYIIMQVSVLITAACIVNDRYAFAYCAEGLTFQCLPFLCVFRPSALRVFLTVFLIHSLIIGILRNNNICFSALLIILNIPSPYITIGVEKSARYKCVHREV